ncbi:PH domain-containing protein [Rhodococcus sp. NPDC058521]|uniref:PH domain-containing protein n=1 Tax=Rhodococcus sp. NPDC058521 TaxID=3346536 RepID=UPI003658C540
MTRPPTVTMSDPKWRPSPKAKQLWAIQAITIWVPVLVVALVLAAIGFWPTWVHVVIVAAALVAGLAHIAVVPAWRYRVHRWEISDTAVYTRTGWFDQERRIAPITRVQTVDTERGPLERMLGLATVTVTTASSAGAVEIVGLDLEVADRTVAQLTEIAQQNASDAT